MDEFEQDIDKYYKIKYLIVKIKWAQSGSGNRHVINYREFKNADNGTDTVIFAGNDLPCFSIRIHKTGEAVLESVTRRKDCFVDDHDNSKDLVRAAFQLAKNKGAKSLEISDNSFIQCPEKVMLGDLYFLTTGKTWYESIIPLKSNKMALIEKFRELVKSNTWSSVYSKLIIYNPSLKDYNFDFDTDANKVGSAMEILSELKKSRDHCKFFSENMNELLLSSGITTMCNFTWSASL